MAAPRTPIPMTMTAEPGRAAAALYRLLAWLSPSFPVGAFSYSHGLEAAAAAGMVHDRASIEGWIAAIVARGSGRIDADILCEAYRAARAGDEAGIDIANRRGLAFRATAELALEAGQQGEAFLAAWQAAWAAPHPGPLPAGGERESGWIARTQSATALRVLSAAFPRPVYGERDRVRGMLRHSGRVGS